jgi:hypothetical protein
MDEQERAVQLAALAKSRRQLDALGRALASGKFSVRGFWIVRRMHAKRQALVWYRERLAGVASTMRPWKRGARLGKGWSANSRTKD